MGEGAHLESVCVCVCICVTAWPSLLVISLQALRVHQIAVTSALAPVAFRRAQSSSSQTGHLPHPPYP